jgi:hypothetical protein
MRAFSVITFLRSVNGTVSPLIRLLITYVTDEYIVFVTPTALQLSIFERLLQPERVDAVSNGSKAESLTLINLLNKVSSSPILLLEGKEQPDAETVQQVALKDVLKLLPNNVRLEDMHWSGMPECTLCVRELTRFSRKTPGCL